MGLWNHEGDDGEDDDMSDDEFRHEMKRKCYGVRDEV